MKRFDYNGFQAGQSVKGRIWASSPAAAQERLEAREIAVDCIVPVVQKRKLHEHELLQFSEGMAAMLSAGVPLAEAGKLWLEDHPKLGLWSNLFAQVEQGKGFAEALEKIPGVPTYMVAMLRVGEATGTLSDSFRKNYLYLSGKKDLRQSILTAMMYPLVVLGVATVAIAILFLFVLPIFEEMYQRHHAELPLPTQLLLGSLGLLKQFGIWIALAGSGTMMLLIRAWRQEQPGTSWDKALLRTPFLGRIWLDFQWVQFCEGMGQLLHAGIDILESLRILTPLFSNRHYRQRLQGCAEEILKGETPTKAFEKADLLPKKILRMLRLGEEAGRLTQSLTDTGILLKDELEKKVQTSMRLLEPLLIVGMAIAIGGVLIALYLPLFDIVQMME